jgi:hypothetical protein
MRIDTDLSVLRSTRWYEYVIRFAAGGAATVLAGLVADRYGPSIGGLFLAFPVIFPATATLIDSHERNRKAVAGMRGVERGRAAAAADAYGASIGAIGLTAFAIVVWRAIPAHSAWFVLPLATISWLATSLLLWLVREHLWRRLRRSWRLSSTHDHASHVITSGGHIEQKRK